MRNFLILIFFLSSSSLFAQFNAIYPIGDRPAVGSRAGLTNRETILFEALPIVRYSLHNKIRNVLNNSQKYATAFYISYRPQLRMYTSESLPVKMPSYRAFLGGQFFKQISDTRQFAISIESGHYSNGQSGCAYDKTLVDGSDSCVSLYESILNPSTDLSDELNRKNGEFSTNLTEVVFNYRISNLGDEFIRNSIHSFNAGFDYYHRHFFGLLDFGGFSSEDIQIYGRWRTMASYEFITPVQALRKTKLAEYFSHASLKQSIEIIHGAHAHVNPIRLNLTGSVFFRNGFGLFLSVVHGHDNYNIRFVDSGTEYAGGVTWSIFPYAQLFKDKAGKNTQMGRRKQ